jgi:cell division transport system permease protein
MKIYYYIKTAFKNICANKALNIVTILAIAFSALIVSTFSLFFINAGKIFDDGSRDLKIMVYLKPNIIQNNISFLKHKFSETEALENIKFISKNEALKLLQKKFSSKASLFQNIDDNPLPDAFELIIKKGYFQEEGLKNFVKDLKTNPDIEDVNYSDEFIGRFSALFNIFKFSCIAISLILLSAAIFFVSNGIRTALYVRRDEIEILSLTGAKSSFIKIPFYIESVICATLGAFLGFFILYLCFIIINSKYMAGNILPEILNISFIPISIILEIVAGSIIAGCMGCFISLKRFLTT